MDLQTVHQILQLMCLNYFLFVIVKLVPHSELSQLHN